MKIRHTHMAGIHVADTRYRTSQGMMAVAVGGYYETRHSVEAALRNAIKQSTTQGRRRTRKGPTARTVRPLQNT